QQVGEENAPVVEIRAQADQMVRGEKDDVPTQAVVAAEGSEQERRHPVACDAGQVYEIVGEEVDPGDRKVYPGGQRKREQHQHVPDPGCAGTLRGGSSVRHRRRDGIPNEKAVSTKSEADGLTLGCLAPRASARRSLGDVRRGRDRDTWTYSGRRWPSRPCRRHRAAALRPRSYMPAAGR